MYEAKFNRAARAFVEPLEDRRLLSTAVFSGLGSTDSNSNFIWSDPNNWQGNAAPTPGQAVEFPDLNGANRKGIVLSGNVSVGDMTFDGSDYFITSQLQITINGNVTDNGDDNQVNTNLAIGHNTDVTVAPSKFLELGPIVDNGHAFTLTKLGDGGLDLGDSTYTGQTFANQGDFSLDETLDSTIKVNAGGLLDGDFGTAAGLIGNGGTVGLSTDGFASQLFFTGDVSLNSATTLVENYDGSGGKLVASGSSVDLGGAILGVQLLQSATPSVGTVLTVIDNQTGQAVSGTFGGLPQGAVAKFGNLYYQIDYAGGVSGHDVTLTVVSPPAAPTVVSVTPNQTISSNQKTLSILGQDPPTGDDSSLTYTWSMTHAPSGAKPVIFSASGTNAAKNAIAHFSKDGTYHLTCTITSSDGKTVTKTVSIKIDQVATALRLAPHKKIMQPGEKVQYSGMVVDQFGHAMRTATPPPIFALQGDDGAFDADGLFTAGDNSGHVIVDISIGDLSGTLGATIV